MSASPAPVTSPPTPLLQSSDEVALRAIPFRLMDAWNRGSGDDFAAVFTENADFIAFEGTHLHGRREIATFHQHAFDTLVRGTHLEAAVRFVRPLSPEVAVVHAVCSVTLRGRAKPSPSRDSMQLFVASKHDGEWAVEALLNARKVPPERQALWDEFEALPDDARRLITETIASLGEFRSPEREHEPSKT